MSNDQRETKRIHQSAFLFEKCTNPQLIIGNFYKIMIDILNWIGYSEVWPLLCSGPVESKF